MLYIFDTIVVCSITHKYVLLYIISFEFQIMSKTEHLKVSDCDLPPAEKYPGKKYRQNPTGSSDFATKNEWVENEASKWYDKMKDHPKFD